MGLDLVFQSFADNSGGRKNSQTLVCIPDYITHCALWMHVYKWFYNYFMMAQFYCTVFVYVNNVMWKVSKMPILWFCRAIFLIILIYFNKLGASKNWGEQSLHWPAWVLGMEELKRFLSLFPWSQPYTKTPAGLGRLAHDNRSYVLGLTLPILGPVVSTELPTFPEAPVAFSCSQSI